MPEDTPDAPERFFGKRTFGKKDDTSVDHTLDLIAAIKELAEKSVQAGLSAEQFEAVLERVGEKNAVAMHRALIPENPYHPEISAFSYPEGDRERPKPKLRVPTYFCFIEEREDRLTPAEIDGYNKLTDYREARGGTWKAEIKRNGQKEALFVTVPFETETERYALPSLVLIQHELAGGQSTADVHQLVKQIETLKTLALQRGINVEELEASLLQS